MPLYHLTRPESVTAILNEGLTPSDNRNATDPLRVAEETRDRLLDTYARDAHGSEYPLRRESVFFYTDPDFVVNEADTGNATPLVVDPDNLDDASIFSADRMLVEDLFNDIKQGILDGTLTDPAYDRESIEARARRIATGDFAPWDGTTDANRELWVARRISPEYIRKWE